MVTLCCVVDIDGNERANVLAKRGATLDSLITEHMQPSIQSVETTMNSIMIEKCLNRWENSESVSKSQNNYLTITNELQKT